MIFHKKIKWFSIWCLILLLLIFGLIRRFSLYVFFLKIFIRNNFGIKIGDINFIWMSNLHCISVSFPSDFLFKQSHITHSYFCCTMCRLHAYIFISYAFKDTLKNKSIEASRNFWTSKICCIWLLSFTHFPSFHNSFWYQM